MDYEYDFLVFLGRLQPITKAHESVIRLALTKARMVVVGLGSAGSPRTYRNPFTWKERAEMIEASFDQAERDRILAIPIVDFSYSDEEWAMNVQQSVNAVTTMYHIGAQKPRIGLIGHKKDASSYYLDLFPSWPGEDAPAFTSKELISATFVRDHLYDPGGNIDPQDSFWEGVINQRVLEILQGKHAETLKSFGDEKQSYEKYWAEWGRGPFVAVDAVVIWNRQVLLIERGRWPGKGLLALPGGFLDRDETLLAGARRELLEETGLVLKNMPTDVKVFDDPHRSARGRMITHAHCWKIGTPESPPTVQGMDDAAKAMWVPLSEIDRSNMFADHFHILRAFL